MTEHSPEVALWRAVIVQMLDDAFLAPKSREKALLRQQARSWFNTRSFREVCKMASANHHAIMREFQRREDGAHAV